MKFNFEELINKVSNKKSYLETMQMLANKKATLIKLNKFCDMCNNKLKMQSYIEVKAIKKSSENIYCDECGSYLGRANYYEDEWNLVFPLKKEDGSTAQQIYNKKKKKNPHYGSKTVFSCEDCGWCYNVSTNKDWYESDDNREIDYGDEW